MKITKKQWVRSRFKFQLKIKGNRLIAFLMDIFDIIMVLSLLIIPVWLLAKWAPNKMQDVNALLKSASFTEFKSISADFSTPLIALSLIVVLGGTAWILMKWRYYCDKRKAHLKEKAKFYKEQEAYAVAQIKAEEEARILEQVCPLPDQKEKTSSRPRL